MTRKKLRPEETVTGGRVVGQAEVDEGAVSKDSYSPDNFYIASTDIHHQKSSVKVPGTSQTLSLPRYVVAQIAELTEDGSTPYRSGYDLVRDGTFHRVVYLQERRKDKSEERWGSFYQMAEMERHFEDAERQREQVTRAKELIQTGMARGDVLLLQGVVTDAWGLIPNLRSPYKEELTEYLNGLANLGRLPGAGA